VAVAVAVAVTVAMAEVATFNASQLHTHAGRTFGVERVVHRKSSFQTFVFRRSLSLLSSLYLFFHFQ